MAKPQQTTSARKGSIVFYGRGCAYTEEGQYVKESDFQYWQNCCDFFDQVELRLLESPYVTSSKEYSASVRDFRGTALTFRRCGLKASMAMLCTNVKHIWRSSKSIVHFFYFPNTLNVPLFIFAMILRRNTVSYWGNDWGQVGKLFAQQVHNSLRTRLMTYFYRAAQRFISRTSGLAIYAGKQLYEKYGLGLKHALETKPFIMLSRDDMFFREDTCTAESIVIMYAGTFTARKGVMDIVPVVRQLQEKGLNVKMLMAGKGQYEEKLRAAVKVEGLEGAFEFAGYVGDASVLRDMFRQSDILLLPSYMEGFPRVIYEAMSQSLPVVCTKVGSVPARLTDRKNAMLCDPGDTTAMAAAIEALVAEPTLRHAMIETNRKFFEDMCDEKPAPQHARSIHEIFYEN